MHPILFKIGPLSIYSYGTMVAIGFSAAILLIYRYAASFQLDSNKILDISILALIGGIVGARLFYVILEIDYYISRPTEIFNLSKGGLVWYGGFLGGLAASAWYIKRNKLNILDVFDLVAPYMALGQGIGRIGCFLNGCCFGAEAPQHALGVVFPGSSVLRYPTQAYSSFALILIFILLKAWQEKRHFKGEIFFGYCMLYSAKRFVMEFFRSGSPRLAFDLTLYQYISLIIFLVSISLFIIKALKWKKAI